MKKIYLLLNLLFTVTLTLQAQNLIINPGCDDTLAGEKIPHWQEISGNSWTQRCSNPDAYGGTCYFYAGAVETGELAQVIDISNDSTEIDKGTKNYYFTGYIRAYAQSPSDESNIFIYFRDSSYTLLNSFIFGPYTQTQTWLRIDSVLSTPVGTRKIDIRLHSVRHNGSNNDGYYDELYLGNSPLVGMPEVKNNINFTGYPNPTTGLITITLPGSFPECQLSILNINGQQLLHYHVTEPKTIIDISYLQAGVYLIKVQNKNTAEVAKIIKE